MVEYTKEHFNMNKDMNTFKNRFPMLSWIVLPLLVLWLSTNYLIGLTRPVQWQNSNEKESTVVRIDNEVSVPPFEWQNTGIITLWFDDAWFSQYSVGFALLEKYKLKGALAVPVNAVNKEGYMSWNQIQRLQHKGWEITSHSVSHTCDVQLTDDTAKIREVTESLKALNSHGLKANHYVTPCGIGDEITVEAAKNSYLSLRTTEEGINSLPVNNPYSLRIRVIRKDVTVRQIRSWIQDARLSKGWLILSFHQLNDNSKDYGIDEDTFKAIIQEVRQSKLPVVLPSHGLQVSKN